MTRLMRRCLALSFTEHGLLVEAAVLAVLVAAGLRLGRLSTLRPLLAFCARRPRVRATSATAGAVAWAVTAAARRLPGCDTCLVKALTAEVMLRRRKLPSTFRLGVRPAGGTLVAHAWVESGGDVVLGALADLASYQVLSGENMR